MKDNLRLGKANSMQTLVRFSPPQIGQDEIDAVVETLRSGWLTSGPKTLAFEQAFAQRIGCLQAVAVSSCTAGITLALCALGIGRGDKVATSVMTFTATVEAIIACGAEPVLVDIEKDTLNIDVDALQEAVRTQPAIRAVIPVHHAGEACRMDQIEALCRPLGIAIVEDAAHALPTRYRGRMVGAIGDATVFSFYANKTMTTGEGGMVTTNDAVLADRLRSMRLHGIRKPIPIGPEDKPLSWQYDVVAAGSKCNLSDIASAIGLVQLRRADDLHRLRTANAKLYFRALTDLPLRLPHPTGEFEDHSWHLFVIRLDTKKAPITRNELSAALLTAGVETSVHFKPIHMHTHWAKTLNPVHGAFPMAEAAYDEVLSLPVHPGLSEGDVLRVADAITKLLTAP